MSDATGGERAAPDRPVRWLLEFHDERRGLSWRHGVEAPLPADAVRLAWKALLAGHPPIARRGRPSLFERARRAGGEDESGWALYRIRRDGPRASDAVSPAPAA